MVVSGIGVGRFPVMIPPAPHREQVPISGDNKVSEKPLQNKPTSRAIAETAHFGDILPTGAIFDKDSVTEARDMALAGLAQKEMSMYIGGILTPAGIPE